MAKPMFAACLAFLCSVGALHAQEPSTTWSAGVGVQRPWPGETSIGVQLSRVLWSNDLGKLRVEGGVLKVADHGVGLVCVSTPCEGQTYSESFEALATMSLGESGTPANFKPIGLLGVGAYTMRVDGGSGGAPNGALAQGGFGLQLPPSNAQLTLELLLREYFGLGGRNRGAYAIRISHSW
jgi:hypothetical protein